MTNAVKVPAPVRRAMITHARSTYPEEACGLVAGPSSADLRMAYCLTNRDKSPYRFTVDPAEHYRTIRHAERRGWEVVGVFHSHPHSEAWPSAADVAGALDPEWVYLVVSLASSDEPDVRAYELRDGSAVERPIERTG